LSIGYIREIQYPEWLANVVLVKKANGKWRICVDFTDLNKACPKESDPLPSIDALVNSASGCRLLSFVEAFFGYSQIMMHPRDECKTAFMTELLMEEGQAPTQKRPKHQDILGQLQGPWLRGLMRIGTLPLMAEKLTFTCSKRSKINRSIVFKFLSK